MSMSTLKRRLLQYNLRRNTRAGSQINITDVERIIRKEIDGPGMLAGYRGMWHTLRVKYGVFVPRQLVAILQKIIDHDEVEQRKRHRLKRRQYTSPKFLLASRWI